jgi:aspartyl-tRNA(Asn)/glutamyl-tRNA(Gln) amidotransferase subunit C
MKITRELVEYVAHLGRLDLEPQEVEMYTTQIDSILEYMEKLNGLDTTGIEPTSHAVPIECMMREDVPRPSFSVDESVGNAPERKGSFFKVPPVIEVEP